MPAPRTNYAVIAIAVTGLIGVLTIWATIPVLLGPFIFVMLAAAVTITLIQNKHARKPRCPHCNYDTRGLPRETMKCPECGRLLTGL